MERVSRGFLDGQRSCRKASAAATERADKWWCATGDSVEGHGELSASHGKPPNATSRTKRGPPCAGCRASGRRGVADEHENNSWAERWAIWIID
jgi:hypothetical protein